MDMISIMINVRRVVGWEGISPPKPRVLRLPGKQVALFHVNARYIEAVPFTHSHPCRGSSSGPPAKQTSVLTTGAPDMFKEHSF